MEVLARDPSTGEEETGGPLTVDGQLDKRMNTKLSERPCLKNKVGRIEEDTHCWPLTSTYTHVNAYTQTHVCTWAHAHTHRESVRQTDR